jgi:hypothetical protein
MVCIAIGAGMLYTWLGFIVAGIELVLVGVAFELRSKSAGPPT